MMLIMSVNHDDILYSDDDFIIINKKFFQSCAPDKSGDPSLIDELKSLGILSSEAGIIHRIDRPVRGVVLFARTKRGTTAANALLQERKITKKYFAVLTQEPPQSEGVLKNYILKQRQGNKSRIVDQKSSASREGQLKYKLIGKTERYFLIEIDLITGRHHQIRVQFGHLGCPVKGDMKYGAKRTNKEGGIMLFARSIEFAHPFLKKEISVSAPLPEGPLWNCFIPFL